MNRPSRAIYRREDKAQMWRECDSAYELGYVAAEADIAAGLEAMIRTEHDDLWGSYTEYAEGYRECYADYAFDIVRWAERQVPQVPTVDMATTMRLYTEAMRGVK